VGELRCPYTPHTPTPPPHGGEGWLPPRAETIALGEEPHHFAIQNARNLLRVLQFLPTSRGCSEVWGGGSKTARNGIPPTRILTPYPPHLVPIPTRIQFEFDSVSFLDMKHLQGGIMRAVPFLAGWGVE